MKSAIIKRALGIILMLAMVISIVPTAIAAERGSESFVSPEGSYVISQTDYSITNGVKETQVILNNDSGSAQVYGYMTTVEPGASVKLKASYSGYYTEGSTPESRAEASKNLKWDMRTTTGQAADYEKATGETVVLATNADYYNMQTGQCCGYLIMEGNVVQTSGGSSEPYFAVLKDGTYAIRDYGTPTDDVEEAISGPFFLLRNGALMVGQDNALAPRNSIGLKADGSVVMFLADGRAGISAGMSVYDVAEIMKAQGVVDAIYLDGGGSATIASRHEGSETLDVQNHPSDGPERVVASTLLLVSTAEETGTFDHAALKPKNEVYIAGAQVQFLANGVDAGGYPTAIPTNVKWSLADDSFGTIDSTGLFRSNGKCGTVTVNLVVSNKVVGTTSIEIQEPDELFFPADSLNLAFNTTSDLDLTVRYQSRLMNLGGVVLDWKIVSKTDGVDADGIGTMNGNLFTTVKAKQTLNAEITVSYTRKSDSAVLTDTIAVEIGRMPEVIWDFEPDENGELIQCGNYDWGSQTYGNYFGDESMELTYIDWNDDTNLPATVTKNGPFQFGGSYIGNYADKTYTPACYVFGSAGYEFFTWHTSYMQQNSATAEVVSAENGETRFGDYALRLDYDYTNLNPGYKNVNEYLYYSDTGDDAKSDIYAGRALDGAPSGLGVWVYAPEGTPNFWLWTQIGYYDAQSESYKRATVHFTTQEGRSIQYNGIYWEGWMYCEADLTPYAQYITPEHPLKLLNGMPVILLTFIPGGSANENGTKIPMGDFAKGSLYFDNFRAVYGDNTDDMESPVINKVSANDAELSDDCVTVDKNSVQIKAEFDDPVSDNATGIKAEKTAIYVDGFQQKLTSSTETTAQALVTLPNGYHSVTVSVYDGFGNQTKKTYYIEVVDESSTLGAVELTGEATAVIGESYELLLNAKTSDQINQIHAVITLNEVFGAPNVTFENGYTGTFTYEDGKLTIDASAETPAAATAARITFAVDPALARSTVFNYSVKEGSFVDGETTLTFASLPSSTTLTANYEISSDIMVVNSTGKIYVSNADGSAPGKVEIYRVVDGSEPELLGTTNAAGVLITNKLCQNAGETYVIYAKGKDGYSFRLSGVTNAIGSDDVTPTNVRLNAVTSPATSQSISWFSAPEYTDKKAVVQYAQGALTKGTDAEYTTVVGSSELIEFNGGAGDHNVSLVNTVLLENLEPGTTYHYRVGDGNEGHWSALRQFTTATDDAGTSFFVIGDTQLSGSETEESPEIIAMNKIADAINLADVDFGIQTGDFVDTAGSLPRWNQILGLFSDEYPSLPIVQVLGNHEYYSNTSGSIANTIFDLPDKDYYSVEYGNVYLAVINCNADIETAAKWLVEDAAKSDCTWKVLTLHQPPYYTNPKGSSDPYNKTIPAAAEAAGIDFVFSGHDHAYARTEPILAGEVNETNGIVYFICGDLGEKSRSSSYAPENNPDFHFAKITQDYDAIYLIVNTTDTTMTVTTYDLDGTVIDSYTKEIEAPTPPTPPEEEHNYVYDRANDKLICSNEGCEAVAPADYTGWATDSASGKDMYFIGGKYQTGWFSLGDDIYHFDAETGEKHEFATVNDVKTTCTEQGYLEIVCSCGEKNYSLHGKPTGHVNVETTTEDGIRYVCKYCGRVSLYNMTFGDVADSDWFAPYIAYAVENELVYGRSALTFDPQTPMTRAEFVSVIWRVDGKPEFDNTSQPVYSDCIGNAWYTAGVNWSTKYGIVNGVGNGLFDPHGNITREQIATILYRYAEYIEFEHEGVSADYKSMFVDGNSVSAYADEAMSWAVGAGLIQGNDLNELVPQGLATRAEVATMVVRYYKLINAVE